MEKKVEFNAGDVVQVVSRSALRALGIGDSGCHELIGKVATIDVIHADLEGRQAIKLLGWWVPLDALQLYVEPADPEPDYSQVTNVGLPAEPEVADAANDEVVQEEAIAA